MRLASLVLALVVISMPAIANPDTLKCTTETGESAGDLTVDLERKDCAVEARAPS